MTMEMHRGSAAAPPSPCALERKPSPVPGIGANFVTQVVKPQCFTNALKVGLADHSRAQPQRLTLGFVSRLRHANPGSVMPAQPWRGPEPMYTTVVTPKLALMPVPGEGPGRLHRHGLRPVVRIHPARRRNLALTNARHPEGAAAPTLRSHRCPAATEGSIAGVAIRLRSRIATDGERA